MDGKEERQILGSPNFRNGLKPPGQDEAVAAGELVEEPLTPVSGQLEESQAGAVVPAVTHEAEVADVEPVEAEPSQYVRDLQLRFFQELSQGNRLKAFVEFGVVAQIKGRIDHSMERRLFRRAIRQGMAKEIEQRLDAAKLLKENTET